MVGIGPDRDTGNSDRELEEEHLRITICLGFVEGASYIVEFRLELRTDENGQRQRRYGRSEDGLCWVWSCRRSWAGTRSLIRIHLDHGDAEGLAQHVGDGYAVHRASVSSSIPFRCLPFHFL